MNYEMTTFGRALRAAEMIGFEGMTIRQVAKEMGVSKSLVFNWIHEVVKNETPTLYSVVRTKLESNFANKHLVGGEATKRKYAEKR